MQLTLPKGSVIRSWGVMPATKSRFSPRLRGIRRFATNESGVTAIEFAILSPVLMLLIFGILEFSAIMLVNNIMESATAITSRLGKTGYADSTDNLSRSDTILNSVKARTQGLVDPAHLSITAKSYAQFNEIDPEPYIDANGNGQYDQGESYTDINGNGHYDADMGTAGYGGAGDIVVYTVSYPWPVMTPLLRTIIGDANGDYIITARAVVKNEPYNH